MMTVDRHDEDVVIVKTTMTDDDDDVDVEPTFGLW